MGMVALKCPGCGADIELDDSREFGFCNYCGTKVMQDKIIVEHQGKVKVDKSDELDNLIIAARNAIKAGNYDLAIKHYERISILNPNSWEALFFPMICKFDNLTNGEMHSYALEIKNANPTIFELIKDYVEDKQEQLDAIDDVVNMSYTVASSLMDSSLAFRKSLNSGNGLMALTGVTGAISSASSATKNINEDRERALAIANIMWLCGDSIESTFDMEDKDYSNYAVEAWKKAVDLNKQFINTRNAQLFDANSQSRISKKINKYDSSYAVVEEKDAPSGGGCYVATAVYGSYDCPQVWTLRRYRDNQLAKTWYGRAFIHTYYAISPTIVKWFGETNWFKNMWRGKLDKMVKRLQNEGVESTPYEDKEW